MIHPRKHIECNYFTATVDEYFDSLVKYRVQRVLAVIAYKDGVEQQTIAERPDVHPNTVRNWLNRLERLESDPFEEVVHDDPHPGQSRASTKLNMNNSSKLSMSLHKKLAWTLARGQFR